MTNRRLLLRRGTASEHSSFIGEVGEITYVTDGSPQVRIHDGSTAGGITLSSGVSEIGSLSDVNLTSPPNPGDVLSWDDANSEWINSPGTIVSASETVSGKIRIATSLEATNGTDDLTAMTPLKVKSVVDAAVVGGLTYQGTFDTSSPVDLSNAQKGDLYIISVAGSYQGQTWAVGDHLLVSADMGGTISPSKIDKVDNTDAVTSVAGKTGAVTLVAGDIGGLATVATTGAYSDLSGTPTLAAVATSGAYSDLSGTPTLGTAAAEDVGTAASNVVQLDGSARLPAVDGSQLINLPSAPVTSVAGKTGAVTLVASDIGGLATVATTGAYSDLTGTPTLGTAAPLDVGTSASNVVQLDGSARLPAVDGSQLTNLPSGATTLGALTDVDVTGAVNTNVLKYNSTSGDWEDGAVAYSEVTGTPALATVATTGAYSDLSGTPTLGTAAAEDVGTLAGDVVQLDGSARLPAVDGSQLLNLPGNFYNTLIASLGPTLSQITDSRRQHYNIGLTNPANPITMPAATSAAIGGEVSFYNDGGLQAVINCPSTRLLSGSVVTSFTVEPNEARSFVWVAASALQEITATRIDRLNDVSVSSAVAEDRFKYDGSNWVPVNPFEVVATVTTTTNLTVPEQEQLVRTSGAGITLNLPNIASNSIPAGVRYQLKVTDNNTITVAPNASELLEGVNSSYSTNGAKEALTVICDGTGWWFV